MRRGGGEGRVGGAGEDPVGGLGDLGGGEEGAGALDEEDHVGGAAVGGLEGVQGVQDGGLAGGGVARDGGGRCTASAPAVRAAAAMAGSSVETTTWVTERAPRQARTARPTRGPRPPGRGSWRARPWSRPGRGSRRARRPRGPCARGGRDGAGHGPGRGGAERGCGGRGRGAVPEAVASGAGPEAGVVVIRVLPDGGRRGDALHAVAVRAPRGLPDDPAQAALAGLRRGDVQAVAGEDPRQVAGGRLRGVVGGDRRSAGSARSAATRSRAASKAFSYEPSEATPGGRARSRRASARVPRRAGRSRSAGRSRRSGGCRAPRGPRGR